MTMSKHGWTYKKLGDLTTTINGLWTGKKPPFVNVAVVRNTNFTKDCKLDMTNVAFLNVEQNQYVTRKLYPGDIIVEKSGGSDKQPVGRPVLFNISDGEYSFSNFTSTLRISTNEISSTFLHKVLFAKYLQGVTCKMQSKTTGIRNLNFKAYKSLEIPVPPMGEQEAIVAELDEINSAVDELKLQVADLGTLAQATFYDMFGDPVTNPKAWPVKKLGEVCFLKAGKNIKASELSQKPSEGLYPCYGGNGIRGYIAKKSHEGCFPIIGRQGALCGNVVLATGSFYATEHAVVCQPLEELNTIFLFFALKEMNLNQYAKGVAQPGLAVSSITPLFLPIPPMPLQQEFAARVKAIEEAKAELKAQMADMQALLASRMQYWFD
jgi:type I restriction enzyme S subunit